MEPVGLHADHFHHLAAARDQFGQVLAVGIGERTRFGTDAFREQRNDLGIERIGLGEPPGGTGEVPDLARIDDGERPPVASSTIKAGARVRSSLTNC
jgi:hypothetical protein